MAHNEIKCSNSNSHFRNGMSNMDAQWLPVSSPLGVPPKPCNTIATQTVGLFYPSTRGMEKDKEREEEKLAYEKQMRDRRPLLTAISPGKGMVYFRTFSCGSKKL